MRKALTIILLLVAVAGMAIADEQLVGFGRTYWGTSQSINTTTTCVQSASNDSVCMLFPAGSGLKWRDRLTVFGMSGAGTCCFATRHSGMNVNAYEDGTTVGACVRMSAAGVRAKTASWQEMIDLSLGGVSTAIGLCSTSVTRGKDTLFAPCAVDDDCNNYGDGVCSGTGTNPAITAAQKYDASVLAYCEGAAGAVTFDIEKERIPK